MKMTYKENHRKSGIKIGDKVKILRKAESFECGWKNGWVPEMNRMVGMTSIITGDSGEYGFVLEDGLGYPYFVLEIVSETYLDGHKKSGIKVGDQVKVLRIARSYERKWENVWPESMDKSVGKVLRVTKDSGERGFELEAYFDYPYFVLEKIKKPRVEYLFITLTNGPNKIVLTKNELVPSIVKDGSIDTISLTTNPVIEIRTSGTFKGKALYLESGYDWILGKDDEGLIVLVPIKKE